MQSVIQEVKKSLMAVVSSGGFKERDQGFGRSLADQVRTKDSLSPAQAYHALQMLHRGGYGQQIEKHGYKLPEIGALPAPVKKPINGQQNSYQPQLQFDRNVIGSAKVENKRIVLEIEKGDVASLLKAKVPESVWKEKDKHWLIPLSSASYLLNLGLKGIKLDPMIEKIVNKQKVLAEIGRATDCDFDVKLATGSLLPYQRAGVRALDMGGRMLLADPPGLGKTLQSLAYMELHPEMRPGIVVCPASLKINWSREIDKWMTKGKTFEILKGRTPKPLPYADIFIVNYDILDDWVDTLKSLNPKIVIADEAHLLCNRKSGRTKAFRNLITDTAPYLILATGTPVPNRSADLWGLLNMVAPHSFPDFYTFAQRYCNPSQRTVTIKRKKMVNGKPVEISMEKKAWNFNGASNLEELNSRLAPYMIRREKEEVLKDLPDKRRTTIEIEMSPKFKSAYIAALGESKDAAKDEDTGNKAQKRMATLAKIEKCKQVVVEAKLDQAIDWIKNFLATGEKLVVFAVHKFVVSRLKKEFGDICVVINGETSDINRQKAVDAFQGDSQCKILLANIKSGGVGLTLTAACTVLTLEYEWRPLDHDQAEDRCHRIGQKSSVMCYYMIVAKTIEEKIVSLLNNKKYVVDTIVDGKVGEMDFSIENDLIEYIKSGE